ncbi:MAG: recombinase family protein [Candidatus Metalachnospira sp.]|nr:recombinase family protein [Candidatus Metalachnospira sp.]
MPKIRVAAYCRVSTDKEDQLSSLDMQKNFFEDYSQQNNYQLVELYTDEGISGTKLKNRKAFNQMMEDAKSGKFSIVFVKDISRFSRNAVDFLQSIRELKSLGIQCRFVNSNLSTEDGEFTLGILALMAQEESCNMSKRVKFGKTKNAMNGKVPNLVYGYDKTAGKLFSLSINPTEAITVKRIYSMYTNSGYGASKIAQILNSEGYLTKRSCKWSQNAVSRILSNPIYIGQVVNGKEEVQDFLTGKRQKRAKDNWYVTYNPELIIIPKKQFLKAQEILSSRHDAFKITKKRQSSKNVFSTLIKCNNCGYSFRRINIERSSAMYTKWVCCGTNAKGTDFCNNRTKIDETELTNAICRYLIGIIYDKDKFISDTANEIRKKYNENTPVVSADKIKKNLDRFKKAKGKQTEMFESDIINIAELKERTKNLNGDIQKCLNLLDSINNSKNEDHIAKIINQHCTDIHSIINCQFMDNLLLKKFLDRITVSEDGDIKVYFKI